MIASSTREIFRPDGLLRFTAMSLTCVGIIAAAFLLMQLAVEVQLLAGVRPLP
jgi:hypothetical protein